MSDWTRNENLTDAQIRAIIEQARLQATGGKAGAVARAGLGTLALVLAVFASTEAETVGLILLCGIFVLGLAAYIRTVARAASEDHRRRRRESEPLDRPAVARSRVPAHERTIGS